MIWSSHISVEAERRQENRDIDVREPLIQHYEKLLKKEEARRLKQLAQEERNRRAYRHS